MKENYDNDTLAQKEALINEFKGNLFEFLLAKDLSLQLGLYNVFIAAFVQDKYKQQQFQQYESWLRQHAPEVLDGLPVLSSQLAKGLNLYLAKILTGKLKTVELVGKSFNKKQDYSNEADILLTDVNGALYPISIKLCKKGSFVNTKSAGVGSFLKKYFSLFESSLFHQEELNHLLDLSFKEMGQKLYDQYDMIFTGQFGREWSELGQSHLPGQLDPHSRKIVHQSYAPIINKIYESFQFFISQNPEDFRLCLQSLLGQTEKNIIQALCFHEGTHNYQFDHYVIESNQEIREQLSTMTLLPFDKEKASFDIQLKSSKLQIRVKPMNKFTSKSHKINCSYKRRVVSNKEQSF